jgi:hypothetical protein
LRHSTHEGMIGGLVQTFLRYTLKKRDLVRKIEAVLARNALQYRAGGYLTGGGLAPSKKLGDLIHGRDMPAIHREFDRAMESVEAKPRDAVSAASNILESIFKIYIEDNGLQMPDKQDLQPVFKVAGAHPLRQSVDGAESDRRERNLRPAGPSHSGCRPCEASPSTPRHVDL